MQMCDTCLRRLGLAINSGHLVCVRTEYLASPLELYANAAIPREVAKELFFPSRSFAQDAPFIASTFSGWNW